VQELEEAAWRKHGCRE